VLGSVRAGPMQNGGDGVPRRLSVLLCTYVSGVEISAFPPHCVFVLLYSPLSLSAFEARVDGHYAMTLPCRTWRSGMASSGARPVCQVSFP
jgi:hypothetical protein